ncbi:MAG: DNA gyrase subunit A [Candidatus Chisholmbacteria bacterium]|nr:DNA gyrase subunit A [Candidatus Chisholmbacteria bacterium]
MSDQEKKADKKNQPQAELSLAKVTDAKKTRFGRITPTSITHEMQKSYLDYAMSVIVQRALPDVRDGLKPVHRRILYAMKELNLSHTSAYKKSARIVGEVLGKYHPHGDQAVYDALVRLAQEFSMRYPLIDGQGNFGSVDGDSAAAMRYTEARLAKITQELLWDLEKDTVPFIDNFDGSYTEPAVLPAKLPNLLLMGSDGIAVGMATKIPPHNLGEVVASLNVIIKKARITRDATALNQIKEADLATTDPQLLAGEFESETTIDELLTHIQGPDFPTGGTIFDQKEIEETYRTGRGRIIMRAIAEIKELKGGRHQIVITELPYQVNKARLVAKIAHLVRKKAITGIKNLRDESDRRGLSVVIELARDGRPKAILNNLFKHTELQSNFAVNCVALDSTGTPHLMNLKTVLTEYLKHRLLVVIRRSQFELREARARAHILEGLMIALDHIDAVIDTIKKSKDTDTAKINLMKKFKLTEIQATAILDMQLRRLAALERQKIKDEYDLIQETIRYLVSLLKEPEKVLGVINNELSDLKTKYADPRRTQVFKRGLKDLSDTDLVPKEDCLVTLTAGGYIKRLPPTTYRAQRRGGKGVTGMTTKDEDSIAFLLTANTHQTLLVTTDKGRAFALKVFDLPEGSRQSKGQAIINLINIEPGEKVQAVLATKGELGESKDRYLLMVTSLGTVKKTPLSAFKNMRSSGIIALKLGTNDRLIWVRETKGHDHIILVSQKGKAIRFKETDVRPMGRNTKGVRGIKLGSGDKVVGLVSAPEKPVKTPGSRTRPFHDVLIVTEKGFGKRTDVSEFPMQKRGGMGVRTANLTDRTGPIVSARLVTHRTDQAIITSKKAQVIKLPIKNIKRIGRATQGVILMRFAKPADSVAAVTTIKKSQIEETEAESDET